MWGAGFFPTENPEALENLLRSPYFVHVEVYFRSHRLTFSGNAQKQDR